MNSRKRSAISPGDGGTAAKRRHEEVIEIEDDDESMVAIPARIRVQKGKESVVRRSRRNGKSHMGSSAQRRNSEVIEISDDEEPLNSILSKARTQENSEPLARQHCRSETSTSGAALRSPDGHPRGGEMLDDDERLARQLQEEWNNMPLYLEENPTASQSACMEDDEALARQLARDWENVDNNTPHSPTPIAIDSRGQMNLKGKAVETAQFRTATSQLEQYKGLFVGTRRCKCGKELQSPRGYVTYSTQIPPPPLVSLLHAVCKSCNTCCCRGCLKPVSCPANCRGKDAACSVLSCCVEGRAIALFEALGGFDRQYLGERANSEARAKDAVKLHSSNVGTVGPGGTGYSTGGLAMHYIASGRGRGRGRGRAMTIPQYSSASRNAELASHWDQVVSWALTTVTNLLPSPYAAEPQIYDMLPHVSTVFLLSASQLPELLGSLLRNDSVTDWIARIDVYHAMLTLLRRLADCELTIEVLTGQRYELEKSCGLEEWMWGDGDITWAKEQVAGGRPGEFVKAPPLYAHFKKLTKQCETFLSGASSMSGNSDGDEDVAETMVKATSLCGDIIAARDAIERAMKVVGKDPSVLSHDDPGPSLESEQAPSLRKGKQKAMDPSAAMERVYSQECERLAFAYGSLSEQSGRGQGLQYPTFHYAQDVAQSATATRNPKDRLHFLKELAVMATSLPPGVWMRVDEVRNDVIKIVIAGPEGTPYEGGLFEFDCFIPIAYPNCPPLFHLRTTGGGTVRFNPNLYHNGKVCLSLLGTWAGSPEEQWIPGKSTLLQVVVSIQSMILVELPYFNEPGYGKARANHPPSISYNRDIHVHCVRWAMVEWFKEEHKNGIWVEVIASHFSTRGDKIRKCILGWAQQEPRIRGYTPNQTAGHLYSPLLDDGGGVGAIVDSLWDAGYEHLPSTARFSNAITSSPQGMDLLVEFDRGVEKVSKWRNAG